MPTATAPNYDALAALMDGAVERIVATEDFDATLAWMRESDRIGSVMPPDSPVQVEHSVAAMLTRCVWNATPLPSNRFRPDPLPKPQRNRPCPCGSGVKYKRCCAGLPLPDFDPEEIWFMAVGHFNAEQIEQAVAAHAIPAQALAQVAGDALDAGHAGKAKTLLEPLFDGDVRALDARYELALDQLCDVYNALGHTRKKQALLDRLTREAGAELRAAAWQRLATVRIDAGDSPGAWQAFGQAQRSDPQHLALASLEVMLLMGEGRPAQASARARFWRGKLERNERAAPELLDFLDDMASDPDGAVLGAEPGARLSRIAACLEAADGRALPAYTLGDEAPAESTDEVVEHARRQLVDMGISGDQAKHALEQLQLDLLDDPAEAGDPPPPEEQPSQVLEPPAEIAALEQRWRAAAPVGKPFSVNFRAPGADDAWGPHSDEDWLELLEREPAALDSVDILDDLAAMLDGHDLAATPTLEARCYLPVLQRGVAILDAAVHTAPEAQMHWSHTQNRPALRLLYRYALWLEDAGDPAATQGRLRQYLALNPHDNHGARCQAIEALLRAGDDRQALALCERYPDDAFADIAFGAVLAHYRLGDTAAAGAALQRAHQINAHVIPMLSRAKVRRPELSEYGMTLGGEDQAWFYREDMRDVWAGVPGLLDWARRQVG